MAETTDPVDTVVRDWPKVLKIIREFDGAFPYAEQEGDDATVYEYDHAIQALAKAREAGLESSASFQARVQAWMLACFGEKIANDRKERNHRFLEEALELVQAHSCTREEAHMLVDYVYGRPDGDANQEVGGVMVTLAALCLANGLAMHNAGETELTRVWSKIEQIRAKQAAKPKHSPLPA